MWEWSVGPSINLLVCPEVREWSAGPFEGPAVVSRPSQRSGRGQEAVPKVQAWSGGPSGGPGVVGRTFRRSEHGR